MTATTARERDAAGAAILTLVLCFLTAVIEGIDLQSMGLAAPKMRAEFGLSAQHLGWVLTASPFGLFFGAFLGGRLADQFGRKFALLFSMVVFGVFQLSTVAAPGYEALVAIRFLCGLGLGGALPNLVALTSEASGGRNSILNVVITAAGMPTGGSIASFIVFVGASGRVEYDWRVLFYIGGVAPLVLAVAMAFLLPESRLFREEKAAGSSRNINTLKVLFGGGRAPATTTLWIAFFFTTLVTYLLLNWLPVLMKSRGFSSKDAFLIQLMFNVGSAIGSIALGWVMQQRPSRWVLLLSYAALAASLAWFMAGHTVAMAAMAITSVGTFLLGVQYILYGLSPGYYPRQARGTGTGAAVAVGRLGSAVGPNLGGWLVGMGLSSTQVLQWLLPVTGLAAVAALLLMLCRRGED